MRVFFLLGLAACLSATAGQQPPAQQLSVPQAPAAVREFNDRLGQSGASRVAEAARARVDYFIGPEDLLEISVFEVPELSRTVRVSATGEISLPLLSVVRVGGLSALETERVLTELLRQKYMKDPHVTVFVKEFKSDPVSVLGAVRNPNNYYVQTPKRLLEILGMAGGFSEIGRTPGRTILIVRGQAYRNSGDPSAPPGTQAQPGDVEVPIKELVQGIDSKWDILIYPGDTVKVTLAGTVYVAGNVVRPGGFPLVDFDSISAIQALALAGGTSRSASRRNATIIHIGEDGKRAERAIDLGRVLKGRDPDTKLGPNDVLFVPGSVGKESALRAVEASIQVGTGLLIWRR